MNYSLNELNENIGKEGQKELGTKTVALVGLGGVGSTIAQLLVRNGINLRIVDKDRIYEQDVPRQTLYVKEDVSKFKAKQAKKRLEEINKEAKIKTFHEDLHKENMFLLESDLIIDTSNDFATSLLINDFAVAKDIPLVFINYSGEVGNVLVVDRQQFRKGPCVECIPDKLELPPIKEVGVYPPITTILAGLGVNAAMKNLLGFENVDTLLKVDVFKTEIRHMSVEKKRGCKSGKK